DGALRTVDVAAIPEVVFRGEAMPLLIEDAVVALVAEPVLREPAKCFLLRAVPILGLVIGVGHVAERESKGDLGRVAIAIGGRAALAGREPAGRVRAVRRVERLR